jgi:hypothetical protein
MPEKSPGSNASSKPDYRSVDEIAKAKRLDPQWLRELGIEDIRGGGISIPYFPEEGEEPLFKKKRGIPRAPRFFYEPKGSKLRLYGLWRLDRCRRLGYAWLCEGESDTWALWAENLPALGLPGATGANAIHAEDLEGINDLCLPPDNDKAGQETFVDSVAKHLGAIGWSGYLWRVPVPSEFKDISEWRARDPTSFKEELNKAKERNRVWVEIKHHEHNGAARNGDGCKHSSRASHQSKPPPLVETFTAADLMRMTIPPPCWAVEEIIPEGLTILGGKPKLGKSWMALHVALAVSCGGIALGSIDVEAGDVLYLALEDTKRRLQSRIGRLLGPDEYPSDRLHLQHSWPRMGKGGLEALGEWIARHPDVRLIIIDTWVKFRPVRPGKSDSYEIDYADGTEVKELADKHGVSIIIIHHCRKLGSTDPVEEISGSVGLTGACDGVLVLRRERGQCDASLFVTGRDVDEVELALTFNKEHCLWQLVGDAESYRLSKQRTEILDLFADDDMELSPKQIEAMTGLKPETVRQRVSRMARDGQLIPTERGHYRRAPKPEPPNPFIDGD